MSEAERRRQRRRRKVTRSVKRTLTGIVLAPARMPRITGEKAENLMRICEIVAILFVALLILHMAFPEFMGVTIVVIAGAVFAGLLALIRLGDYQDKLVEYELYGFKI